VDPLSPVVGSESHLAWQVRFEVQTTGDQSPSAVDSHGHLAFGSARSPPGPSTRSHIVVARRSVKGDSRAR
jgi:hypothetical protein